MCERPKCAQRDRFSICFMRARVHRPRKRANELQQLPMALTFLCPAETVRCATFCSSSRQDGVSGVKSMRSGKPRVCPVPFAGDAGRRSAPLSFVFGSDKCRQPKQRGSLRTRHFCSLGRVPGEQSCMRVPSVASLLTFFSNAFIDHENDSTQRTFFSTRVIECASN